MQPLALYDIMLVCTRFLPQERVLFNPLLLQLEEMIFDESRYEVPFGNLTHLKELGEGEFGVVVKMALKKVSSGASTLVAVKMLKPEATEKAKADFFREMHLMKKLRHPNLVSALTYRYG